MHHLCFIVVVVFLFHIAVDQFPKPMDSQCLFFLIYTFIKMKAGWHTEERDWDTEKMQNHFSTIKNQINCSPTQLLTRAKDALNHCCKWIENELTNAADNSKCKYTQTIEIIHKSLTQFCVKELHFRMMYQHHHHHHRLILD